MMCVFFLHRKEGDILQRLKMNIQENNMTFEEGFHEFTFSCLSRNLRPDSVTHYENSYNQIIKHLNKDIKISEITKETFNNFVVEVKKNKNISSMTLYTYARDLSRIIHFFQEKEYLPAFRMILPKVDKKPIETYTDDEIEKLLKKPNIKKCNFAEFRNYCLVAMFFSTGLRVSSVVNIKIKDVDFNDDTLKITHTKNRKQLTLPITRELRKILLEYLKYRQQKSDNDWLFCTVYGKQLNRNSMTQAIEDYNKRRGVNTVSIHKMRHTFAKKWIMSGKSVVTLQKVLSHSSLQMTQNYINILVPDIKEDMQDNNILQEFSNNHINMRKQVNNYVRNRYSERQR